LRLDPSLELLVQAFDRIRGADRFPLALRKAREGEQLVAGLIEAVGDGLAFQPPFADECLACGASIWMRERRQSKWLCSGRDVMMIVARRQ